MPFSFIPTVPADLHSAMVRYPKSSDPTSVYLHIDIAGFYDFDLTPASLIR